ncbi:Charged multivesicular body protein, putative [Pediculus humanus corporis]|uniref:Charged multivesicular body protein, putative n=1 Tax=Pediculus humanus subsp. corporis TaxID=121224 RepID=E0VCY2_PEDHC|nr:Charged multivesicular body protein, putative [Pediculus humanus corporis]EEB11238.1 Charged multivesicular body protein, putative [Pediculus humanus corporis]
MGIFFSRKKTRITEQDKAILQLKQQRDKLRQYQKKIENNLGRDRELAKTLIQNGRKERALSLLRKKRFQEEQLNKLDKMLENIEKMTTDLEFTQVEMNVIEGLKAGNVALKKLHEIISVDDVERIMDETRDGIEKQQEIDNLLHGALTEEDEEAVLDELNEILSGSEETTGIVNKLDNLPEVPESLETEEEEEEEEEEAAAAEPVERKKIKKNNRREKIALEG